MESFFANYWAEILLTLITAGSLAFCRYIYKQMKNYKKLLDQQNEEALLNLITTKLKPIETSIQDLFNELRELKLLHNQHIESILKSYRFRLIQLCKTYLDQGYMTSKQYEQLSEFFKLYSELGGNSQAKEYYERTVELPIHDK